MSGTDVYNNTSVVAGNWSDTVGYTPASGSTPASVAVGGVAGSDAVLNGTVSAPGDSVTVTFTSDGQQVQEQLTAVCDIIGGAVFQDATQDYFLFSDAALQFGNSYNAVSGFGYFSAGQTNPSCFAAGTCIDSEHGPVPVEQLRPGDRVRALRRSTRCGGFAEVVWTGRIQVVCARSVDPRTVWPVRIAADAFGPGQPRRELWLSPDHAVFERGVLVPIRHLLNGATIVQVPVERIGYWHVELPQHDVILAEGLPTESFLDTGNRHWFAPGWPGAAPSTVVPLAPAGAGGAAAAEGLSAQQAWATRACARLVTDAAALWPLRRRLREHARVAGWVESGDAELSLFAGSTRLETAWDGRLASATIPPGSSVLRLVSRSAVPSELAESSTDSRRLGVAVSRLCIEGRALRLDDPRMRAGWHQMEPGWRWTEGDAAIPLTPLRRPRRVEVETTPMLGYWKAPAATAAPLLTRPARHAA